MEVSWIKQFQGYNSDRSNLPREWFARTDPNPTGFIDFHQMKKAFKFADLVLEDRAAVLMLKMLGIPENGLISEDQFLSIWDYFCAKKDKFQQLGGFEKGLTLQQCMEALDKEVGLLNQFGGQGTIEKLFEQLDSNKLGKLDWHQFIELAYLTGGVLTMLEGGRTAQKSNKPEDILPQVVPGFVSTK